jgi:hypothetical protein
MDRRKPAVRRCVLGPGMLDRDGFRGTDNAGGGNRNTGL